MVARIPTLRYLDDRPVFDDERERAEAWYAAFQIGWSSFISHFELLLPKIFFKQSQLIGFPLMLSITNR